MAYTLDAAPEEDETSKPKRLPWVREVAPGFPHHTTAPLASPAARGFVP
jgi:hypothetical protein